LFSFSSIPLKQNFTINFIETKFKEILRSIELSKEFYFKPNRPPSLCKEDSNKNLQIEQLNENIKLKIDDFNFITVYLFEDFYLNQFKRNDVSYFISSFVKIFFNFLIFKFSISSEDLNENEILNRLNIESFDILSCDDCLMTFSSLQFYLFEFFINNLTQDILQQTNRLNE
jgi:hypothetical protein